MLTCVKESPFARTECSVTNIVFPQSGQLRSRQVISRSNSKPTMKYPSWKNSRMIHCESKHELNACFLLDADVSVKSFSEQPCRIDYTVLEDQKLSHYPDFLVVKENGYKEFWEVKANLEVESEDVFLRGQVLKNLLPDLGYEYRLVCGKEMSAQSELNNARYLTRHGRTPLNIKTFDLALNQFLDMGVSRWGDFMPFNHTTKNTSVLCRLILESFVSYDLDSEISSSSKIWWNSTSKGLEV